MDEIFAGMVRAFEQMAAAYHLLAGHLHGEIGRLQEEGRRLRQEIEQLESRTRALGESAAEMGKLLGTERTRVRDLEGQNAELERLNRQKSEFLATVSHELRTPLTSIRGALHVLLTEAPGAEVQREFLGIAQQNGERLLRLIGNLLDLAKMEGGHLALDRRPVDLGEVIRTSVETLREAAREKGIEIQLLQPQSLPKVLADEDHLKSVVLNLLDNAIKFSDQAGRVRIEVADAGTGAQVTVVDAGPGVPADELPRIFERYYQGERRAGGAGLGLHISRAIVEGHGGRIWAESPGRGSRFSFTIPWAPREG